MYVYGLVPAVGVTVMEPVFAPHVVGTVEVLAGSEFSLNILIVSKL